MDEVIKKFNNLEDKIRSVLAEQYPDIFKSILKLNGKTEKIYDAIVSVSNAANVIKLSCALKCLRKLRLPHVNRKYKEYHEQCLTPYPIMHIGIDSFQRTGYSEVERAVLGW